MPGFYVVNLTDKFYCNGPQMKNEKLAGMVVIERARLSEVVYRQLLGEIVGEHYGVGDQLPTEHQLARHFSVSRPVVREALMRLQSDGVIIARQGSGRYVQRKPSQQVAELTGDSYLRAVLQGFELRLSLETLSARLAARNRTDAQVGAIEEAADSLRFAFANRVTRDDEKEADYGFHRAIAIAGGNDLLIDVLDGIAERLKAGMRVTLSLTHEASEQRRARVLDEHDRILRAIRVGDAESAEIAMRYHVDQARNRLLDRQLDR
jgi:GntR family transcriptional repressor for pyruvate dehydrogenase complex